ALPQSREFRRCFLYRVPVTARSRPSPKVARGQYHSRAARLAALSTRRAVVATQCADCRRAQPPGSQGDLFAVYRRASAGCGRATDDTARERPALRAVRTLAKAPNPIARRGEQSAPFLHPGWALRR